MTYNRPTDGLDKNARLHVEGVRKEKMPVNDNEEGWIALGGFADPDEPPVGHIVELRRDSFLGMAYAFRFVPASQSEAAA